MAKECFRQKQKIFKYGKILLIALFTVLMCRPVSVQAKESKQVEEQENHEVLFISSYSYTWFTVPLQLEGIQSALDSSVTLDTEFMDTKIIRSDMAEQILLEKIRFKQQNGWAYDAVIVGDDAALVFAMKYREELFPDIPIVFEGINNIEYASKVSENSLITGVIERYSFEENMDFAKKIQPEAKKVVAIVDDTVTGIGEQQQFFAQEKNYPELSFEIINSSLLTRQQLIESISNVDKDTILIYLILSEDADGNIYTNEQACKLLKDYSKVPVLRFVQAGIGEGVLGGNIVMHQEEGRIAADMVMQMLRGEKPASIEMVSESPNGFYFDQQVLDQFNISKALIPDDAIIINRRLGFWEKYSFEILVTLCISAAVMFITLVSVRTVYAHRRYVELEKSNQQLEIAVNEAQSATRAKSVFLHSMSHDIRTPMNAIIGFTNIAIQQNTNVTVGEYLQKIMTSSKHLLSLINDVLDLSRIENGKAVYTPVATDLCAINQEVMDINQGFVSEKNIILQTDFPESDQNCIVLADPVCVKEILMNILSNAIKFTEEEGSIKFCMDINPGEDEKHIVVCYTISDTGCGMSSDFLPHVFDEFAQEESGARTQYKGTGLGMAISRRYVDMMGGTINVESKLGEGTTVVIKLPLELTDAKQQKKMTVPAMKEELNGVMVLMAEDNDLNAEIATVQLENCGMKVTRAVNGKDVVNIFANQPAGTYDVILMDIMMPEMNGYEAAKAIRDLENRPDGKEIPIIATTANAFVEDIQAALDAGMNGHLAKPLNMEEVKKTILVNLR